MMFDFHTHDLQCAAGLVSLEKGQLFQVRYASLELHPWRLPPEITPEWRAAALTAAAVGEVGLDKLKGAPFDHQLRLFKEVLAIAGSLHKPLVIHCVRATDEVIQCCQPYPEMPKLIHNFNSKIVHLEKFFQHGFWVSFGPGSIQRPEYLPLIRQHLDHVGLESDDSGIAITEVYRQAAAALGMPVAEITTLLEHNFCNFLGI